MTEHNINGGKVNITGDASIVFKTNGKEVFRIEDPYWSGTRTPETQLHVLTHEEMLEIAAEREAVNKTALESMGIDYENFGQKPWDESMLEEAENNALNALDNLHQNNDNGLTELADMEREERMNEDQRIKVIQTACGAIDKYSDALKALAETEKVEMRAELEAKKKENFQLIADAAMKEYEQKYGRDVFPVDEYWVYMISEYFATGEGQTTCIMMTQATPYGDDFTEENRYVPVNSKQYRAVREFHKQFGTWYLHGLKFLSKEDFFIECAYYIPPVMMKLSNKSCFKDFYTRVHYNFS